MPRKRVQNNPALVDKARHAGRVQWYNKLLTDGNLQAAEQYAAKHLLLPLGGAGVSQSNGIAIPNQLPPSENFSPNGIASQNAVVEALEGDSFSEAIPAGHFYTAEQAIALPPEAALPSPEADFATFKAGDAPLTSELSNSTTAADFAAWVDAPPVVPDSVTFTPSEPLQEFRPALEPLPQGVRWATVIREPHNQRMKLVRFADGGQEGIAWVGMRDVARAGGRMEGIMIRVVPNPDELQGGWMIWRG